MALPPGPARPPGIQALGWALRPAPLLRACRDRYGDAFTLRFAGVGTYVVLADPAEVRAVFAAGPDVLRAGEGNILLRRMLGPSRVLMLLDGPAHLARRRVMLPPFHGARLARWREVIADEAGSAVDAWPVGRPFAVQRPMLDLTLDVILRVVFGLDERGRLAEIRARLRELIAAAAHPAAMISWVRRDLGRRSPWARFQARRRAAEAALHAEIAQRRADPATAERDDVLSVLLAARDEAGRPLPDAEVCDELLTLLAAGHETTATSLAWAFERLTRHPEALDRLAAEAREDAGEAFADAVIREVLRLRPPLPLLSRRVVAPFAAGGHELPVGAIASPCPWLVHRRPDLYADPEVFRPERFLGAPPDASAWLPFGGGTRRCLGASFAVLEMRIVLQEVLRRVRLRPTAGPGEGTTRRAIVLAPAAGATITVAARG
jgi:cytochrome P450 family 135